MSWQGWFNRGPSLRQEPTPEPAPLTFHKPRAKRRILKPFAIEVRHLNWRWTSPDWRIAAKFETAERRDAALAKFMRVDHRPGKTEYRAAPPSTPATEAP